VSAAPPHDPHDRAATEAAPPPVRPAATRRRRGLASAPHLDLRAGPRLALSQRGRWLVGASALWIATGLLFALPPVTALGALPAVALVGAFAQARWVRHRLASAPLDVRLGVGPLAHGASRPGDGPPRARDIRIRAGLDAAFGLVVTLPEGVAAHALNLEPVASSPLEAHITESSALQEDAPGDAAAGPRFAFDLRLSSGRAGHGWLHGFFTTASVVGGLFEVRTWTPAMSPVQVVPRHFPLRSEAELRATRASMQEHSGATIQRRRGLGMEIRELRDFQAGDPFKHIAWSASARRGKLISREFESELVLSTWILVDCSPSMFWGAPGRARVDYAVETAYNLAAVLLGRRDRAGVLVHDHTVRLQVPPSTANGQLGRILDALMEVPHLVHEDRTEVTDRELVERVARWFEVQTGRSFALPEGLVKRGSPRVSHFDEARLVEAAQELLAELSGRARRRLPVPIDGYASDYQRSLLRAFCRHRGISLPLDPTPRPGGQAQGLEAAVQAVLAGRGGPHTMVAITDMYTADQRDTLRRVALTARRHHCSMVVLCPDHRSFDLSEVTAADPLQEAIVEVERLRVQAGLNLARAVLRPAGTVFLSVGPDDAVSRVLARLRQVA